MSGVKRAAGEDSLSSAEEEDDKRRRNRRRPRALTNVSNIVAPAPLPGAVHAALPDAEHPMMKTIAELVAEHRHLDTSKAQSQMCETASSKLSARSASRTRAHDELKQVDHEKAAEVDPWQNKLFLLKMASLPRAQYYFRSVQPTLSHDQLLTMLKQRQVQLPLLTAEYEQSIMAEAGAFEGSPVTYPMCANGAQCVTNTMNIPDPDGVGKFISTALMYPEELESLKATGTQPVSRRPCILCCRYHLADYVLTMRMMKMSNESDARSGAADAISDTPQIHQLYRNLVDRPGGYYKEYMLIAREEEAILDPVVMFSCSPLRLVKYHGRRVVDQNTLVWRPPSTLNANVGEKPLTLSLCCTFLPTTHSRQSCLESDVWWKHQRHLSRIDASIPDYCLLRKRVIPHPLQRVLPVQCMSQSMMIDRFACDEVASSGSVSAAHSLAAAITSDALRDLPYTPHFRTVPVFEAEWDTVIHPLTLPNLQHEVFQVALCVPINSVTSKICRVLSKTIVQRCMTRKFGSVCLHDFRVETNRKKEVVYDGRLVMVQVRQLVLCSFLGNYEHCGTASRPLRETRKFFYDKMFHPSSEAANTEWFYNFFKHCSHVIVFALRDYLVFAFNDNPALRAHFSSLTSFDDFQSITCDAMDAIRCFFRDNQQALYNSDTNLAMFEQLNRLIAPFHEKILKVSYKRMSASVIPSIVAVRKSLPMQPIPGGFAAVESSEDDHDDPLQLDLNDDDDDNDDNDAIEPPFDIRSYIKQPQLDALRSIVERVVPLQQGIMRRCIGFFGFFGIPFGSIRYLQQVIQEIHEGSISSREEATRLRRLYRKDPHAYTLLQVTAELVREAQSIRIAATLPLHYWHNQIEAAQGRFGLQGTQCVVSSSMYFYFCSICDTVYSLVSEFNSVYKQHYLYGLRNAVVEYATDRIYCNRSKHNHRGSCRNQPLQAVPILGTLLQFNNKHIMLCPQPRCGMPMVFDATQCAYTEYGPACVACTKIDKQRVTQPVDEQQQQLQATLACLMCGPASRAKRKLTIHNMHLYPAGVMLCAQHHFAGLQEHITKHTTRDMGAAEIGAEIVKFVTEWRAQHKRKKEQYCEWQLKKYKSDTRNAQSRR